MAGAPSGYSGTFEVDANHVASRNDDDAFNPRTGVYGAASTLGSGADQDVVVSFEGTNTADLETQPPFAINELRADVQLYKGQLPAALVQAATFARAIVATAASDGISSDHVFMTGHSLGATGAEYAGIATGLSGTSFGTPGISSTSVPSGSTSGLTDDVARGDPVGNDAHTGPTSPEGAFISSDGIEHVGLTTYLGSRAEAIPLRRAGQAFGTGDPVAQVGALGAFYDAAETFHPPTVYAASLGHSLADPPAGATSFGGSNVARILSTIAQHLIGTSV